MRMLTSLLYRWHLRRFLSACDDPLAAQGARLRSILRAAAHTMIGRRHDFAALARIEDPAAMIAAYRSCVPIRTYEQMRFELRAVHRGKWRALCPTPPTFFTLTAGSTGAFKYIPVTAGSKREVGRASLIFSGALEARFPGLRRKRWQFLVGSADGGASPAGVPQGFASGHNYQRLPWFVRRRFVLPYWVFTLPDAGERAYAAARMLVAARDLGALCAITPLNLIDLRRSLEADPERLRFDVATGRVTLPSGAGAEWRTTPDPELAFRLTEGRRAGGRYPDALLFPSLEVLVCWEGGSLGYYRPELEGEFPGIPHHEFPISASEAVFAIPLEAGDVGGVAAVTSQFLEFVPEDTGEGAGSALRADELLEGRTYRIIVTTSGGLYRYDMEDLVEVTAHRGRTPVLRFVAKSDRRVSVANERLTERDVAEAMRAACADHPFRPADFLFVPCSDRRYRLLLDGDGAPADAHLLRALAHRVDRELRVASKGYDFEREDRLIAPLEVLVTPPGRLRLHLAGGGPGLPNAQLKPRRLTRERDLHLAFDPEGTRAVPDP